MAFLIKQICQKNKDKGNFSSVKYKQIQRCQENTTHKDEIFIVANIYLKIMYICIYNLVYLI